MIFPRKFPGSTIALVLRIREHIDRHSAAGRCNFNLLINRYLYCYDGEPQEGAGSNTPCVFLLCARWNLFTIDTISEPLTLFDPQGSGWVFLRKSIAV